MTYRRSQVWVEWVTLISSWQAMYSCHRRSSGVILVLNGARDYNHSALPRINAPQGGSGASSWGRGAGFSSTMPAQGTPGQVRGQGEFVGVAARNSAVRRDHEEYSPPHLSNLCTLLHRWLPFSVAPNSPPRSTLAASINKYVSTL